MLEFLLKMLARKTIRQIGNATLDATPLEVAAVTAVAAFELAWLSAKVLLAVVFVAGGLMLLLHGTPEYQFLAAGALCAFFAWRFSRRRRSARVSAFLAQLPAPGPSPQSGRRPPGAPAA